MERKRRRLENGAILYWQGDHQAAYSRLKNHKSSKELKIWLKPARKVLAIMPGRGMRQTFEDLPTRIQDFLLAFPKSDIYNPINS